MRILDDVDHVESKDFDSFIVFFSNSLIPGQNSGHEVDILLSSSIVPSAIDRVGCGQNGATRVEGRCDSGLDTIIVHYLKVSIISFLLF